MNSQQSHGYSWLARHNTIPFHVNPSTRIVRYSIRVVTVVGLECRLAPKGCLHVIMGVCGMVQIDKNLIEQALKTFVSDARNDSKVANSLLLEFHGQIWLSRDLRCPRYAAFQNTVQNGLLNITWDLFWNTLDKPRSLPGFIASTRTMVAFCYLVEIRW